MGLPFFELTISCAVALLMHRPDQQEAQIACVRKLTQRVPTLRSLNVRLVPF